MEPSRNGLLFIARREALVLTAYQDGKHLSVGFGHNDPTLRPGDQITPRRAFELLRSDIAPRVAQILRRLKVEIPQHQFDAVFSLYYQGGTDGLDAVLAHVNRADHQGAARELLLWDTDAAGNRLAGLLKRRGLEVGLYLGGEYGALSPIPFWRGDPRTTRRDEYAVQDGDL